MMSIISEVSDGILTITLNRPDALNSLNAATCSALLGAADRAAQDDVKAVVLTATGRGFCSGVDIRETSDPLMFQQVLRRLFHPFMLSFEQSAKPLVTAINGVTAGAGLGMALMGDVRVGTRASRFVPAFVSQGLVPDAGTTHFAVRSMGYDRALRFLVGDDQVNSDEALALGILTELAPEDDLQSRAREIATNLARLPTAAVRATVRLLRTTATSPLASQLEAEARAQDLLSGDPVTKALRADVRRRVLKEA